LKVARTIFIPTAKTLLLVALATIVLFVCSGALETVNLVSVAYLVPVVLAALWWGTWPALLAAIAGAMAADFFFYPPLYSFVISDTQNIADLIGFLIVALVSGNLAADLQRREREVQDLYRFSRQLAACFTVQDLIGATQNYFHESLGRPAILVERKSVDDESAEAAGVPKTVQLNAKEVISRGELAAHTTVDVSTGHIWLVRPLSLGSTPYVVFVDLGTGTIRSRRRLNRRIDNILMDATNNLLRLDLAAAMERHRLQAQADTLKNALVATMSHELRSPLVSILGAASVLDQIAAVRQDSRARSLVESVHEEAVRLDDNIRNILDAVRISAGEERSSAEFSDPVDMVRAAIALKRTQLANHKVDVALAPDLPLVRVQSALIENALAQLLDNAAKYSPAGSVIEIEGRHDRDRLVLSVQDRGFGLAPEETPQLGQRSFRGARHADSIPGSGLGLWIANTFVEANGGRLEAESAGPGQGTIVRLVLPVVSDSGWTQKT
jgi:two-component system sensor histidine kinase KdpD